MSTLTAPRTPAATPGELLRLRGLDVLGVTAVLLGLVVLLLGFAGALAATDVDVQLAFTASGGVLGLGIVALGCGLLVVQAERHATREVARAWRAVGEESRALVRAHAAATGPAAGVAS